jgi:hypothetical protein
MGWGNRSVWIVRLATASLVGSLTVSACSESDGDGGGGAAGSGGGAAGSGDGLGGGQDLPPAAGNGGVGAEPPGGSSGQATGGSDGGALTGGGGGEQPGAAGAGGNGGAAGNAGQGGEAGAETSCLATPAVVLEPGRCFTHGQCQTGQACAGTQTAKVCVPRGEGCDAPADCPDGKTCSDHRCVPAPAIGSPCPDERCSVDAYCGQELVYDEFAEQWYPDGAEQCRPRETKSQAPCLFTADPAGSCGGQLVCSPNRLIDPGEPFEYCFPRGGAQFVCITHNDCLPGFFCDPADFPQDQVCMPERLAGDHCLDESSHGDERCAAGLYCPTTASNDEIDDSYQCRALPALCEACTAKSGCLGDAYCQHGLCVPKPLLGQPCDTAPCAGGLVCVTGQVDGVCQ